MPERGPLCLYSPAVLSQGVKEGDVLREENGVFKTDPDETSERRKRIRQKMKNLFSLAPFFL